MSTETLKEETTRLREQAGKAVERYQALDKILWRERGLPDPKSTEPVEALSATLRENDAALSSLLQVTRQALTEQSKVYMDCIQGAEIQRENTPISTSIVFGYKHAIDKTQELEAIIESGAAVADLQAFVESGGLDAVVQGMHNASNRIKPNAIGSQAFKADARAFCALAEPCLISPEKQQRAAR